VKISALKIYICIICAEVTKVTRHYGNGIFKHGGYQYSTMETRVKDW